MNKKPQAQMQFFDQWNYEIHKDNQIAQYILRLLTNEVMRLLNDQNGSVARLEHYVHYYLVAREIVV